MGWLDLVPHSSVVPDPPSLHWVQTEAVTESLEEQLESRSHDVSARWCQNVEPLAEPKNRQTNDEHDGRDQISQPEADVAFSVDHADLTNQCTDVDEQVKVVVDTGGSDSGIDNDALALGGSLDTHLLLGNLLGNERRNVGLECTSSESHDDQAENENAEGSVWLGQDMWGRGGDEDEMTDFSDQDGVNDGLEATEIGIRNPSTEQRTAVDPEGVEGGQTEGNLLAHVEGTGLGVGGIRIQGSTSRSLQRFGDEVGVDSDSAVVGHALNEFDKGNLHVQN